MTFSKEIMEDIINNNSIYKIDDFALCIKYDLEYNCFVWCTEKGELIKDNTDIFGIKRVVLSPKLFGEYTLIK